MAFFRSTAIFIVTGMLLITVRAYSEDYHVYHHCYQEGAKCGTKSITCHNNTVIDIVWSRIGYSTYWILDPYHTNCSVTNESCFKEIEEPKRNCTGKSHCVMYTCSSSTSKVIHCTGYNATNYMQINYTCVPANSSPTTTIVSTSHKLSSSVITSSASTTIASESGNDRDPAKEISKSSKVATIAVVTLVTVAIIIIVIIILIRRRHKGRKHSREEPIQASHADKSINEEPYMTVSGNMIYLTTVDITKAKDTSGLSTRNVNETPTGRDLDDDNYVILDPEDDKY